MLYFVSVQIVPICLVPNCCIVRPHLAEVEVLLLFFSHLPVETHTLTSVETLLTAAETQHRHTWFNLTVIQGNLQDSESV